MNQLLATHQLQKRIKSQVNNPTMSDVTFLVGPRRVPIYAHRWLLALGSPVFFNHFYGSNPKDPKEAIEVPDQSHVGFLNLIKFFYGHSVIAFDLDQIYCTYMASEAYEVPELSNALIQHAFSKLEKHNAIVIYNELIRLPHGVTSLEKVQSEIMTFPITAFHSEDFFKIEKATLVSILQLPYLSMDEVHILKAVAEWTDREVIRLGLKPTVENKQKVFADFKCLIVFSNISIEELIEFGRIEDLLPADEVGSLFVHLADIDKPLAIECKTKRLSQFQAGF